MVGIYGNKEYLGVIGKVGNDEWHVHNIGSGHIKLGEKFRVNFEPGQPVVNWEKCQTALAYLDAHPGGLPNYQVLRDEIVRIQKDFFRPPEIDGGMKGDIKLWSKEAQKRAQQIMERSEEGDKNNDWAKCFADATTRNRWGFE